MNRLWHSPASPTPPLPVAGGSPAQAHHRRG